MSFTFNGIAFSSYGVEVIEGFTPTGATSNPVSAIGLPAAARVWYQRGEAAPIEIEFPVRIQAASAGALVTALDNIHAALSTTDDKALEFWYTDRYWLARWDGRALRMPVLNTTTLTTTIRFLAQPNMLKSGSEESGSCVITTNPQTVYVPGPLVGDGVCAGNTTTAPVLILENTGASIAAAELEIWNYVTGDYLNYSDSVPTTTWVKFDCATRIAYTSPDGSTWTPQTGRVSTNWLTFTGGAAAQLVVIGCAAGELSWTYRGRFL